MRFLAVPVDLVVGALSALLSQASERTDRLVRAGPVGRRLRFYLADASTLAQWNS
jgi:hypothetical protein